MVFRSCALAYFPFAIILVFVALSVPTPVIADGDASGRRTRDDPAYVTGSVGWYDVGGDDQAAEFRLEFRPNLALWIFKPYLALAGTSTGSFFAGGGILADIGITDRWVVVGSIGANYYRQGGADLNLGGSFQIRSQVEVAYRFDDRSRLGLAFSHYSNGGTSDENPGVETLLLVYSFPLP